MKKYIRKLYYKIRNIRFQIRYLLTKQNESKPNGIVLITHDFERRGAPVLLLHIAKWLKLHGYNLVVLCTKYGPMIDDFQSIATVKIGNHAEICKFAYYLYQERGYYTAICNTVVTGDMVEPLKKSGYTVVSMIHEMKKLIIDGGYNQNCDAIATFADAIIFPSSYGKKSFAECISVSMRDKKIHIKNQGLFHIDDRKLSKNTMRSSIGRLFQIDLKTKFVVLNVATACYRKGFDIFLDVAYQLSDNSDFFFIWVGDNTGVLYHQKLQQYKVKQFDNLLLPGYVTDDEILNDMYGAADILCLTSREEPFGSIVLEAFKAGTPVMAFSGCGGYMDVVSDNKTGYLVEPFNVDEMANKLVEISANGEQHQSIALNCIQEVGKHSFDSYCKYIGNYFDERTKHGEF